MFTMKEACEKTDMTYEALKFYCNQGLVPNVKRDKNNRRIFSEQDVTWIKSLTCLKDCGMSIQEMKSFVALCQKGKSSIPERKLILAKKKEQLLKNIEELHACVDYIDWKQQFYNDVLSGKIEYHSNLAPQEEA